MALETKTASGWCSASKKSALFRCPSRLGSRVSMLSTGIRTSIFEAAGFSGS